MKLAYLLFYFSILSHSICAQVIGGRVLDFETGAPIDIASVFFNGTFLGCTTDENGEFELDITPYANRTLQISAMGYKTNSLNGLRGSDFYEVLLERDLHQIPELIVESKSLARKRKAYMRIFKNEFIGRSQNAEDCYILNEEDITFNYHSSRDTLIASARKPLHILNKALGYQITYYLDKFEYDKRKNICVFKGNIIYNIDLATNSRERAGYEKRREKAYMGSCMHFFRALWDNTIEAEGFYLEEAKGMKPVTFHDIVMDVQGKKYFSYNENLKIYFGQFQSTAAFRDPGVYFARDGYFEPEGILWFGQMSMDRIADWLPYEFLPQSM